MKKFFYLSLALCLIFYFSGIGFDLPFLKVVSDEDSYSGRIMDMAEKGIWNPKWFYYPPLYFYFVAITAIILKGVSLSIAYFLGAKDVLRGMLSSYPKIIFYALLGRLISAIFGFFSCLLIFKIAKEELRDEIASHISFLLMAISPFLILHSHYAKPDMMQIFLVLLTFYFSLKIYREGKTIYPILAGIFTASAFMTKYSGIVIGGTVAISIILRFLEKRDSFKIFFRNSLLSLIFFLIFIPVFSPFTILDFETFKRDFVLQVSSYQIDPLILSENAWKKQIFNLEKLLGIIPFLFLIYGFILSLKRILKGDLIYLILLSFPILFYIQLGITDQWVERHFLPSLPFLILLSSIAISSFLSHYNLKKIIPLSGAFIFIFSIQPFLSSLHYLSLFHQKDPRHLNREWVEEKIPECIYFAFEERTGLSPSKFGRFYYSFGESPYENFLESPIELLFVSEGIMSQYIQGKKKERFPKYFSAYRWIEENSYLIRVIGEKGYDEKPKIFLYKLKGLYSREGSHFRIEIRGENKSSNIFIVMISKKVILMIPPDSRIEEKRNFNFAKNAIPIFIFTPVRKDGKGSDEKGYFSYKLKILGEEGKLISVFEGKTTQNNPSIHISKIEK
ncbi:MAG: ArnT family glycosyltransferase [Candidatus Aminicenantia bacterium]